MEETTPVWYILTGDRICFDDKEFEDLSDYEYMRWNVEDWAKNENKPAIQWPNTENV